MDISRPAPALAAELAKLALARSCGVRLIPDIHERASACGLVLLTVQDRAPADILATDIEGELASFNLKAQLSSNRTQGIPNMIALIRETAARYAG